MVKVKKRKSTTICTRNAGTMTESEFMGRIRSALRSISRWWIPMKLAIERARRPAVNKGRLKWEFLCAHCTRWFPRKYVELDHIKPCGSLRTLDDVASFIQNMFSEDVNAYQVLCKECHKKKSKQDVEDIRNAGKSI